MKRIILFSIFSIFAVSCEKSVEKACNCMVSIDVNASGEQQSRVSIGENWSVSWVSGESLLALSLLDSSFSEFTMSSYGAEQSAFVGKVTGDSYRLLSPYDSTAEGVSNDYLVDVGQQQAGLNLTYMISDEVISVSEPSTPSMKHIGSAILLNLNFSKSQSAEYYLTAVELCDVPTTVLLDLSAAVDSDGFYGEQSTGSIVVTLDSAVVADGVVSLRFNTLPFEVAAGDKITLKLHLEDGASETSVAQVEIENSSLDTYTFGRATYNTINYSYDLSAFDSSASQSYLLSEISAENIPDTDVWIISDSSAESVDFAGLSGAIQALSASGERTISLEFPNLTSIPATAIFGSETSSDNLNFSALVTLSADVATAIGVSALYTCSSLHTLSLPAVQSVGNYAFSGCSSLSSVDLNSAVTIGGFAFYNCDSLTSLNLATSPDALLSSIHSYAFYGTTSIANIDLVLGVANSSCVDGSKLTVGSFSKTFKSITLQ